MSYRDMPSLVEQIRGISYKPEDVRDHLDDSSITLLRANNIVDGSIELLDVIYVNRKCVSENQILRHGDILICASSGSKNLVGKAAKFMLDGEFTFGAFCKVVRPKDVADGDYISMFFQSPHYRRAISSVAIGANINNIRNEHIDSLKVLWPDFKERKAIEKRLQSIMTVINYRKCQLHALDCLIKARFVEMFGNVNSNEHGWRRGKFAEISTKITDGEHGTVPRVNSDDGYLYFMARNINRKGIIDLTEASYVSPEIHSKIYKRCNPEPDDLLLVCVGATIGKCALVPNDLGPFSMARSVALIKPDREQIVSSFLLHLLRSEDIQKSIAQCSHAAAQAGLYTNMIANLDALIPPLDLQKRFDIFAKQVDKSKVVAQKALDKTQNLFDSLMQKYFG